MIENKLDLNFVIVFCFFVVQAIISEDQIFVNLQYIDLHQLITLEIIFRNCHKLWQRMFANLNYAESTEKHQYVIGLVLKKLVLFEVINW